MVVTSAGTLYGYFLFPLTIDAGNISLEMLLFNLFSPIPITSWKRLFRSHKDGF